MPMEEPGWVLTSRSCPSAVLHLSGPNAVLLMCYPGMGAAEGYVGMKGVGGEEWWVQLQPGLHITVALIIVVISVEG